MYGASDCFGRSGKPCGQGGHSRGRSPDRDRRPRGCGFSGLSGILRGKAADGSASPRGKRDAVFDQKGRIRISRAEFQISDDVAGADVPEPLPVLLRRSTAGKRAAEHARQGRRLANEPDDGQLCNADQHHRSRAGSHHRAARIAALCFRARDRSRFARAPSADAAGAGAFRSAEKAVRQRH